MADAPTRLSASSASGLRRGFASPTAEALNLRSPPASTTSP